MILSYCKNSFNTDSTIVTCIVCQSKQYCHLYYSLLSPVFPPVPGPLPLLNRSRPKSLFALYFSTHAVAASPLAGPCVRGSPSREVIHTQARPPPPGPPSHSPPCSLRPPRSPLCRGDWAATEAMLGADVGRRASVYVDRGQLLLRRPCGASAEMQPQRRRGHSRGDTGGVVASTSTSTPSTSAEP